MIPTASSPDAKRLKADADVGAGTIVHLYRVPGLNASECERLTGRLGSLAAKMPNVETLESEVCFNVCLVPGTASLSEEEQGKVQWLLRETFEPENLAPLSFLASKADKEDPKDRSLFVEVGPRLNFETAWSSNAVSICRACGVNSIVRLERSRRIRVVFASAITDAQRSAAVAALFDRMTECVYEQPLSSLDSGVKPVPTRTIPVMAEGTEALRRASKELGLAFDEWDLEFYTKLFKEKMKRDPTDVECFDLAQSNSEHSRHWFFGGNMIIDGEKQEKTLFKMVKETNPATNGGEKGNSIIAFHDNSSAIRGFPVDACLPNCESVTEAAPRRFTMSNPTFHGILTCETHNFPCGIAPFQGAETGTGGRIRDVQATGAGAYVVAGTSSYCVGNLNIPGYDMAWEEKDWKYPSNMASPLAIEVEASNGASDYGNKFGEPVVSGYSRSFGLKLPNGERREWIKPIMMSAGVGILDDRHKVKGAPEKGMVVVKLGGPAYRIGMGGGAASSKVQDAGSADLDFNAVQRGDAEMENKMNRVIRACVELGDRNPIVSIHDQGAGGNGNVLKEISEPAGAELFLGRLPIGDKTMNAMELWGAEYQENNALLIRAEDKAVFEGICNRENLPFGFLGEITGTGRIIVHDADDESQVPVDLDLEDVLGKMPSKDFVMTRAPTVLSPLELPEDASVALALDRVLRLLQVGSKRFLTNKVDRSVSGLVAQQQCVGPLHTPLADVGVIALSAFGSPVRGVATAIGEQPIKGLVSTSAMARMAVGEALTNLVWARITSLGDVKCSANWMWAAKLPGEGPAMYDACKAMRDVMLELGVAVDGGKDSLSMACSVEGEVVKCPGQLAISLYAMVPDVECLVTPDIKHAKDGSSLVYVDLSGSKARMGGSALAQCYKQIGDVSPDLNDATMFKAAFNTVQSLLEEGELISAGHDRSDGGLLCTVLEMAFAGNCGLDIAVPSDCVPEGASPIEVLFAEELGLVMEVVPGKEEAVLSKFKGANVPAYVIATTNDSGCITVKVADGEALVEGTVADLRDTWESTSFELGKFQARPQLVAQEREALKSQITPPYKLTFTPEPTAPQVIARAPTDKPRMAVLREEGTNGDREMAWAFFAAGFDVWDVSLSDLRSGKITLADFRGVAFAGGFSYADVLDSAKGWAGGILFNEKVKSEFAAFRARPDTFSLGVCNGCQLMALLGWIPALNDDGTAANGGEVDWSKQARFIHNASEKYESRFPTLRIEADSKAIMFKGMEGSQLGCWVAHAEGQAHFPDPSVLKRVVANGQAPVRYVDDHGSPTVTYPFNPNGSPQGVAGMCSADGRHLAMMPHPERVFKRFHWPYMPNEWRSGPDAVKEGPWIRMFQNAFEWCEANK